MKTLPAQNTTSKMKAIVQKLSFSDVAIVLFVGVIIYASINAMMVVA